MYQRATCEATLTSVNIEECQDNAENTIDILQGTIWGLTHFLCNTDELVGDTNKY